MYSAVGLVLLLVLLVLSQKSRGGVVVLQDMLLTPHIEVGQVASPSFVVTEISLLQRAVSAVHDANRQIAEDVRSALYINSVVLNMLVSSFSSSIHKARLSLTPTLHDARYVRDNAFPVVASIPQAQVVAEAGRSLARDFKGGIESNQASVSAVFDGKRSGSAVLTSEAGEDGGKILDAILPIVDASIAYGQRAVSYSLNRVAYLLPNYTEQARILVEAGSKEAKNLWNNREKLLSKFKN